MPDDFVLDEPALDLPANFSCEGGALSVFVALGLRRETEANKSIQLLITKLTKEHRTVAKIEFTVCLPDCTFVRSFVRLSARPFARSSIRSFVRPSRSFAHSFVR